MRFRVLEGTHTSANEVQQDAQGRIISVTPSKTYRKGEVVESDVDLRERFLNKFEKLLDEPTPVPAPAPAPKQVSLGEDVTSKFPKARDADLLVFKGKEGYFVSEPEAVDVPLHATAFGTIAKVNQFLASFVQG